MLYRTLLVLHSWDRWILVVLALAAVLLALKNRSRGEWTPGQDRLSLFLTISADLQLLLGILLYGVVGPWFSMLLKNPGGAMADRVARYWVVEHVFGMIIVIVLIHIGRAKIKRGDSPQRRNRHALIFFGIALLIMLLSMPWPFMPYARPLFHV